MREHLDQAVHNQKFHESLCNNFDDKFYDWKITILFYTALHWLQALASKRGIVIGDTHMEIEANVNPSRDNAKMKISKAAWKNYKSLFRASQNARYEGITDFDSWQEIKKDDYKHCLEYLEQFKRYCIGQQLPVEEASN